MASIKVLGARIAIKEFKNNNKTNSGLIVPGKEKEPTFRGKVIAIGQGALTNSGERIPVSVNIGDIVVYSAFAGSPVYDSEEEETYIILNERDILAVFEK